MNFLEHRREITKLGDDSRKFRQTDELSFGNRTCFVLSELGVEFARNVLSDELCLSTGVLSQRQHPRQQRGPDGAEVGL